MAAVTAEPSAAVAAASAHRSSASSTQHQMSPPSRATRSAKACRHSTAVACGLSLVLTCPRAQVWTGERAALQELLSRPFASAGRPRPSQRHCCSPPAYPHLSRSSLAVAHAHSHHRHPHPRRMSSSCPTHWAAWAVVGTATPTAVSRRSRASRRFAGRGPPAARRSSMNRACAKVAEQYFTVKGAAPAMRCACMHA